MSIHIEWARAVDLPVFLDETEAADLVDGHGSTVDSGNAALAVGDGIIIEGTRAQLAAWLRHALAVVEAADQ